tara:strand:+ start:7741 stop:7926 length:186 start_codon:yes stop_codon:yes gene_type:complete
MLEDALNVIDGVMNNYPAIFKIEIVDKNNFKVHYDTPEDYPKEKSFGSAQEFLDWSDKELK